MRKFLVSKAISKFLVEKNSKVVPSFLRRSFSAFGQLITQPKPNHLLLHSDSGTFAMENHFSFDDYGELELKSTANGHGIYSIITFF